MFNLWEQLAKIMIKELVAQNVRLHILPPAWSGSLYYWFYWSLVAVYAPFLNVYLREIGLSGVQIGVLVSLLPLMSLVAAPILSAWADRHQRRKFLLTAAFVCWGIVLLFYRLPTLFAGFFVLMAFEAFVRSSTTPVGDSLISRMVERHQLDFGRVRLWGSLGFGLTTIAMGIVWDRTGFTPMFFAAALMVLPMLYFTGQLEEETAAAENPVQESPAQERPPLRQLLQDRGLLTLILVALLVGAALIVTFLFAGIYMVNLGGNQTYVGLLFGLSALAEVPVMLRQSHITRRLGAPQTLLLSIVIISVAIGGHAAAWSPLVLVISSIIRGFGYGLFTVGLIQLVNLRTPLAWSSTGLALTSASMVGLAPLLTSILSGYIYDSWGGRTLFAVVMSWAIMGALVMLLAIKKRWFAPIQTEELVRLRDE